MNVQIFTEDEIRAIVQDEMRKSLDTGEMLITIKQASQLAKSMGCPPRKCGYVSIKKLIDRGLIRQGVGTTLLYSSDVREVYRYSNYPAGSEHARKSKALQCLDDMI